MERGGIGIWIRSTTLLSKVGIPATLTFDFIDVSIDWSA